MYIAAKDAGNYIHGFLGKCQMKFAQLPKELTLQKDSYVCVIQKSAARMDYVELKHIEHLPYLQEVFKAIHFTIFVACLE